VYIGSHVNPAHVAREYGHRVTYTEGWTIRRHSGTKIDMQDRYTGIEEVLYTAYLERS
jgi:hypothetical protein